MRPSASIIYHLIETERLRQEFLKQDGRFQFTCADVEMANGDRLAVLMEEVGETAQAVLELSLISHDRHDTTLRKEIVQVAAVCVAWLEGLDNEDEMLAKHLKEKSMEA